MLELETSEMKSKNKRKENDRKEKNWISQSGKIEQIGITFEFVPHNSIDCLVWRISMNIHLWPLFANISLALF